MTPRDWSQLSKRSIDVRRERKIIRERLRSGELDLSEIALTPPPSVERVTLADLISWRITYYGYTRRHQARMEKIGRRAVLDGVNLFVPLHKLTHRTRAWILKVEADGMFKRRTQNKTDS